MEAVWPAAVLNGRPHQQRLLEYVLDVLAGLLHAGLGLVLLAFALGVLVASELAGLFLGLTRDVLSGVLRLIGDSHGVCPFCGDRPRARPIEFREISWQQRCFAL